MQNGYIESFNGRMRDELLNESLFLDLDQARKSSPLGLPTKKVDWPAVFEEFVPYALGGAALLVIGQFAAAKLDFQHLAECCPLVEWNQPENVVGYAGAGR
jgi:hypothetical protein